VLNAYAAGDRVFIDVRDHCGGLPPGAIDTMFTPFVQRSTDKSGLGLGLSIARRNVEADGGTLTVQDKQGTGCVFTMSLPRHQLLRVVVERTSSDGPQSAPPHRPFPSDDPRSLRGTRINLDDGESG
jgi:hypothetical protein